MEATIRPFSLQDAPLNRAQERVARRLKGELARFAKADLTKAEVIAEMREIVGNDPDAAEEVFCNGTIKALRAALEKGSDEVAEFMIQLSELGDAKRTFIVDDETRPRPYWVQFGARGVLVRYMRPTQKGLGTRPNFEVGFTLWGASLVLSRAIIEGSFDLARKDVLELGSGLGLCGLVAGTFGNCKSVHLTDFHPMVVANCRFNLELNGLESMGTAFALDWEAPDEVLESVGPTSNDGSGQYDVVIGSDIVCQPEDCSSIARILSQFLKPSGVAIFVLGSPESRYGVAEFPQTLRNLGFKVELKDEYDGNLSWVSSGDGESLDLLVGHARSYGLYLVTRLPR